VTIDPGEALRQACLTAHDYMLHAQNDIAELFGLEQATPLQPITTHMQC
jgi:hypothetical protein